MKLNQLRDNDGAVKTRFRVGRGSSSGKGKTAGRGVKGQKSRSGVAIKGFEGGQMPVHMRLPKRGFNVPNPKRFNAVNLARLQQALDAKKLDPKMVVNIASLKEAGVIRRELDGVRILGNGELKVKLDFEVAGISAKAKIAVEKLGCGIKIVTRNEQKEKTNLKDTKKGKPSKGKKSDSLAEDKA